MHSDHGWPFLTAPGHPLLSLLWELFVHGSLGILVVAPLIWAGSRRWRLTLLAFSLGVGLDFDHVVAAGSFDPTSLERLGGRPPTHSLLFAATLASLAVLSRRQYLSWAVFAVLSSHLLFDAPGGGVRWLYPLQQPDSIPWLACPLGIAFLFIASWTLTSRRQRRRAYLPDPERASANRLLARRGSNARRGPSQPASAPEIAS